MAEIRTVELNVKTNNKDVQSQFDNLRKSIEKTTKEVEDLSREFGDNSDEVINARRELGKLTLAYDTLSKSATDLNAKFEHVYGDLQPLTARMGEAEDRLYELALAGKQTTREYQDLLETVGRYKQVQQQTDLVVDGAAMTLTQKMMGAVSGTAGAFSAAQGTIALFGVENEELEKILLRVNAAMALTSGLDAIKNSIPSFKSMGKSAMDAFKAIITGTAATKVAAIAQGAYALVVGTTTGALKAFRIALATTGIGAIVVLLGMAASAMDLFGKSTEDAEAKQKELEKQLEKTNLEIERSSKLYEDLGKTIDTVSQQELINAKKRGASEEELNKIKKESVKSRIDLVQEEVDEAEKRYLKFAKSGTTKQFEAAEKTWKEKSEKLTALKLQIEDIEASEIYDKRKENQQKLNDLRNSELEKIKENNKAALAQNQARLRTEQEQEEFLVNEKFNEQIKLAKKYRKDTTQLEIAQANEINEIRLKYQEIDYKQKEEARQKELNAIKQANDLKKQAEEEFQAQIEEIDEANFQARLKKSMSESDYEIELVRQKYFALEEAAKGNAEQEKIIAEAKAKEIEEIDKKSKEKQIQQENELRQKRLQLTASAFTAIGDLIGSFATKSDKDARKQFEIQKAFNLASAVTNTALAVTGALTAGGNPIKLATGAQFVEAGIAATVGAANIVKIASSKFGGGSSGGGETTPSTGAGSQMSAPQFNTIGSSGINQLATLQQQPVQAYVVSGEVTSAQALDRNRVQNATL